MFFKRKKWCVFSPVEKASEKHLVKKWWLQPLGKVFFSDYIFVVRKFREQRCGLKVHSTKKGTQSVLGNVLSNTSSLQEDKPLQFRQVDWYPSSPFLYSHKFYWTNFNITLSFIKSRETKLIVNPIRSKAYLQRTSHPPPQFSQFLW